MSPRGRSQAAAIFSVALLGGGPCFSCIRSAGGILEHQHVSGHRRLQKSHSPGRPAHGCPATRRYPMNRVVGLLLAGLVLLLLSITLTPSQPAQAQVCPVNGDEPGIDCDAAGNCFHHCCLTSGLCPTSSCVSSLDAPNSARALCSNKCLDEVACSPFNPACVPHDNQQSCIGTVVCKTAACDGRSAGSVCLYNGVSVNFLVCEGAR